MGALLVIVAIVGLTVAAGVPGIAHGTLQLDERWKTYLADEQTCPGGDRTDLPVSRQASTMVCLVNFARKQRGVRPLATLGVLTSSSLAKAERIVRCREFSHTACGQGVAADARARGYKASFGENLYIGDGAYGAPRAALAAWLSSPGHRANLFDPEWRTQGIAVERLSRFGEFRDATLWVNEFGAT